VECNPQAVARDGHRTTAWGRQRGAGGYRERGLAQRGLGSGWTSPAGWGGEVWRGAWEAAGREALLSDAAQTAATMQRQPLGLGQ